MQWNVFFYREEVEEDGNDGMSSGEESDLDRQLQDESDEWRLDSVLHNYVNFNLAINYAP